MTERIWLNVTMTLLSDAIFGAGYSIPGAEDIAVCKNDRGLPYLKGSTLKGLVRESVENLVDWAGLSTELPKELFGEEGWEGVTDGRRLQFTALQLLQAPEDPQACYQNRVFTALEQGTVKEGSLRMAACIRAGLEFGGQICCAKEDEELVRQAFAGVKWLGTLRSRGFGRVAFALERVAPAQPARSVLNATCLRYRLRTLLPVMIPNLSKSYGNNSETRGYLPGSVIRGMVLSQLAQQRPGWFEQNRRMLLSDEIRFLNAEPVGAPGALPAIMGFYGDKASDEMISVLNKDVMGKKRAGLGTNCSLEGNTVRFWSSRTSSAMRLNQRTAEDKEDKTLFQVRYLEQDQEFEGYIILPKASFAGVIGEVMQGHVWIGADRYQGYGECEITNLEAVDQPDWIQRYGYRQQSEVGTTLYLLLMAPTAMYNIWGENCGLDLELLKEQLGVEQLEIQACSTAMALFGGYNRTWKCRTKWERMYDRGSIFKLSCEKEAPSLEALQKIQEQGLGMRRAEGYGQVLFLRPELFEAIDRKAPLEQEASEKQQSVQQAVRRAKYRWVMEHSKGLYQNKFSKSQGGALQALCEKAKRRHGDCTELEEHLTKNLEKRGPEYRKRYVHVAALVKSVLESPLAETLSLPSAPDSVEERLQLLIMLFDHSRKMDQQDLQKGEV